MKYRLIIFVSEMTLHSLNENERTRFMLSNDDDDNMTVLPTLEMEEEF